MAVTTSRTLNRSEPARAALLSRAAEGTGSRRAWNPGNASTATVICDGECGLCRTIAGWITRHAPEGGLVTIAYQDARAEVLETEMRARCRRAVHVITPTGAFLKGGRAVLYVVDRMGWATAARVLGRAPFIWLFEAGYAAVAGTRHLLPGCRRLRPDYGR